MGQIIYREYIVFRGSIISCSLATTRRLPFLQRAPSCLNEGRKREVLNCMGQWPPLKPDLKEGTRKTAVRRINCVCAKCSAFFGLWAFVLCHTVRHNGEQRVLNVPWGLGGLGKGICSVGGVFLRFQSSHTCAHAVSVFITSCNLLIQNYVSRWEKQSGRLASNAFRCIGCTDKSSPGQSLSRT